MDWRSIETAPQDGTRVLTLDLELSYICISHWDGDSWCENDYDNLYILPTHWMPLPPALTN